MNDVERALPETQRGRFLEVRDEFDRWYLRERLGAWYVAMSQFKKGAVTLKSFGDWQLALSRLPTPDGPHFAFLRLIEEELSDYKEDSRYVPAPAWLMLVRTLNGVLVSAGGGEVDGSNLVHFGRHLLTATAASGTRGAVATMRGQRAAVEQAQRFLKSMADVWGEVSSGPAQGYRVAADLALQGRDPGIKNGQLQEALRSLAALRSLLGGGKGREATAVWQLMEGTVDLILHYAVREAECELQRQWQERIVAAIQDSKGHRGLLEILNGDGGNGALPKFIKEVAEPFVSRQEGSGYTGVYVRGLTPQLSKEFFVLLNTTAGVRKAKQDTLDEEIRTRWDELQQRIENDSVASQFDELQKAVASIRKEQNHLSIEALPIEVNPGATVLPYSVSLNFQCANGPLALNNLNHRPKLDFSWQFGSCSDARIEIRIGGCP
ncbi:hypothetical protein [Cupriavidus sp. D39]|uniref:hypothetical protein n=1 Tax=Cupriavidus sp. D39 TaxID=2997877 RepID=UPI002271E0F9|nr:hypothetical protein [Cupriavidus sp. D39]MCY0858668.1 hypothetical protein [Cupriavidus sp. D39]